MNSHQPLASISGNPVNFKGVSRDEVMNNLTSYQAVQNIELLPQQNRHFNMTAVVYIGLASTHPCQSTFEVNGKRFGLSDRSLMETLPKMENFFTERGSPSRDWRGQRRPKQGGFSPVIGCRLLQAPFQYGSPDHLRIAGTSSSSCVIDRTRDHPTS